MRVRSLLVLWLGLSISYGASALAARKPDFKRAKRLFTEGLRLFEEKDYLPAAKRFQSAYDITKDPMLLFNVGEAYARGGKPKEAIAAYEAYLKSDSAEGDRQLVERKIAVLRAQLPAKAAAPSKTILPPATPLHPESQPEPVPVARPTPPPSFFPSAPRKQETGTSWLTIAKWTGVGVTVAIGVTAALLALAAGSREDDIAKRQNFRDPVTGRPLDYDTGSTARDLQDLYDQGNTYKDFSRILLGVAGAAAAGTLTLFILDAHRSSEEKPARGPRLGAAASPGGASVSVRMSF